VRAFFFAFKEVFPLPNLALLVLALTASCYCLLGSDGKQGG
jgi:hypothetical protein